MFLRHSTARARSGGSSQNSCMRAPDTRRGSIGSSSRSVVAHSVPVRLWGSPTASTPVLTKAARKGLGNGPAYEPLSMQVVPDADGNGVDEVAVLARRTSDGAFLIQRRNASGSRDPHNAFFLNNGYSPRTFAVLDDADGNTTPDYAVLARRLSNGSNVVQFRNAAGAASPRTIAFLDSTNTPTAIVEVADRDNNGVRDVAVLGHKGSNGRMRANIKNVSGAANSQNVFFSPN